MTAIARQFPRVVLLDNRRQHCLTQYIHATTHATVDRKIEVAKPDKTPHSWNAKPALYPCFSQFD
jgi:hypothetical protein